MASIDNVVGVSITAETTFPTVRDLNTIAVLSEHTVFAEDFRVYESAAALLDDGFLIGDFAYKSASLIFQQNPRARKVIIGKKLSADSYVTAITKLIAATNQWLFLITDAATDADILAIAGFIQTSRKLFGFSSNDPDVLTASTTDIFSQIKALNYDRTFYLYNANVANTVPEAAVIGRFAPEQAGSITWYMKGVSGIVSDRLNSTQEANLLNKNALWYTPLENVDVVFGNGTTAKGEYIDVMIGIEWIRSKVQENVLTTLLNNRKINMDSAGASKIELDLRNVLTEAIERNILAADPPPIIRMPNVLALTPAQRNTRVLPNISFRARLAGAIHATDIVGTVAP